MIAPFQEGYEIHGVRVAVGAPEEHLLERLVALLPRGLPQCEPVESDPQFVVLDAGGGSWRYMGPWGRSPLYPDLTLVLAMLDSELRRWVAERATEVVFVHAGAVAVDGRAIVIPGASFSGKTSLVAELVRAGAEYYSDEYAIIDEDGLVHPYARPLSIRRPGADEDERRTAESMGGTAGHAPIPVGVIASTVYRPGTEVRLEHQSAGQGMLALVANTSGSGEHAPRRMAALRKAAADAIVVAGDRGEAAETARILLDLLASDRQEGGAAATDPVVDHEVAFEVYGTRARVAVPTAELVPMVLERLPRDSTRTEPHEEDHQFALRPGPRGDYEIVYDGVVIVDRQPFDRAISRLGYELFYFATHHARNRLVLSASVVSHEGRGIVVPGVPRCGKSVLLTALLRAGAVYYSDDWGILGPGGLVHPYTTQLRLEGVKVKAETFGAASGEEPVPIGVIAFLAFNEQKTWDVQPRTAAEGTSLLLGHAYGLDDPLTGMQIARSAAAGATIIQGERGEADEAAQRLLELAAQASAVGP